jgi:uncharacterized protein YcaQ
LRPPSWAEEDFFVNYGFLPRVTQALMHPRTPRTELTAVRRTQMDAVLAYVQVRGVVHPHEVDGATLAARRPWPMNWSTWVPFCI